VDISDVSVSVAGLIRSLGLLTLDVVVSFVSFSAEIFLCRSCVSSVSNGGPAVVFVRVAGFVELFDSVGRVEYLLVVVCVVME